MKLRRRIPAAALGIAVATVLALPASVQAQPAADHPATQAALNSYQAQAGPGAGLYAGDSTGSWNLSAGTAVVNTNKPLQPIFHFRIGSQTKTFTAAVVLQLVDEGKVSLDTPIGRYLPGVVDGNGYDGNAITVRQLLQHTSGVAESRNPTSRNPDGTFTLSALVRDGLSYRSVSAPGAEFHYSNTNFQIAGMLIEKITGMPVARAITSRIIEPLGLTQTTFPAAGDRTLPVRFVPGYVGNRIGPLFFWVDNTSEVEPSAYSSAGAIISTQQDLTTFYQALIGGKVVSGASLAEMEKTVPVVQGIGYGLGLESIPLPCGGTAWGHNGAVPGYSSLTTVTADGRHAAVMTNTMHVDTDAGRKQLDATNSALCE
ncbi:serine hydrolase domain-containing protein [Streptomyces hesseae]|uniref:Serine hydrolase domain-containing protein n=1 Tax=Streptomyces hesseae TaxID=3075519 RepID=A0ABU2SP70_9ACTN|nr:serine hydrolase domain-containing protein [Streptomyces sp. DSM 40473]MDT0450774.1 serine hydrolase domain-containing protein [Streptomyces sp. DSM 40473]